MSIQKQDSQAFLSKAPSVIAAIETAIKKSTELIAELQIAGVEAEAPNFKKTCDDMIAITESTIIENAKTLKDGVATLEEKIRKIAIRGGEI